MKSKLLNKLLVFSFILAVIISASSCSKEQPVIMSSNFARADSIGVANTKGSAVKKSVAMDMAYETEESVDNGVYESASPNFERKLIKTGHLNMEVATLSDLDKTVAEFAQKYNGYVTNSSMNENGFDATVRIPNRYFEEAMNSAGDLGKVKYRSVNSQDVSEDFYDLQTRLETKKTMQKKLESYLSSAKDMKDLLEVERQLNMVTTEVESMEGRMKRLSNQIDYSTIYIGMSLPTGYDNSGFNWPDLGESFREFGYNIVKFGAGLLMFLFYLVVYGIPVVAVAAFFFWLLFGRVGLLVKLFKWLKKN